MNKDRIRALADRIEREDRFDYNSFLSGPSGSGEHYEYPQGSLSDHAEALAVGCGTVGCIAGWALTEAWQAGVDVSTDSDEVSIMAQWLEIDYDTADNLAYGGLFQFDELGDRSPIGATAVECAKALREWADGDREIGYS